MQALDAMGYQVFVGKRRQLCAEMSTKYFINQGRQSDVVESEWLRNRLHLKVGPCLPQLSFAAILLAGASAEGDVGMAAPVRWGRSPKFRGWPRELDCSYISFPFGLHRRRPGTWDFTFSPVLIRDFDGHPYISTFRLSLI
jgi:hypothetical protein